MADDYLLGHSEREWDRLAEQHALWGPALLGDLAALGVGGRSRVLEVGCGSGALLADLATLVGPTGVARGIERDEAAVARARAALGDLAEVQQGDLRAAPLGGPWDAVVARWVLSFVDDVPAAVARLAGVVAPGGWLVVHDYNHDGLGVWPSDSAITEVVEAFRTLYRQRGGDLWVTTRLPGAMRAAGLSDVRVVPHCKAGAPDSPTWRWVERFLLEHLSSVREAGLVDDDGAGAFRRAWEARRSDPDALLFSPLQVTVAARRT